MPQILHVAVHTPAYSGIGGLLSYLCAQPLPAGTLVRVPLGSREVPGVVWDATLEPHATHTAPDPAALKPIAGVLEGVAPLSRAWMQLVGFSAHYYQRSLGEVALAALPPQLRGLDKPQLARRIQRASIARTAAWQPPDAPPPPPPLTDEQQAVLACIAADAAAPRHKPFLLFGATGSGKTEIYMQCAQRLLRQDAQAQILLLVPEINLTPQLQSRLSERFGAQTLVTLHSNMTPAQRLRSWLAAHQGTARIVLGTRMGIFASMPHLRLIVVDEEHDPSYKQYEGARYSARDLAVYRAHLENVPVILGSATPSLESWHASRPPARDDAGGRYQRLTMPARIGAAAFPRVRMVNMQQQPRRTVIAAPLLGALQERIDKGEQSLILLNRRGYAPVLHCPDCGWKSDCPHCSAHQVFHKTDRTLRCHHCGMVQHVPRACPRCGNPDIRALGSGTEKIEEHLAELLATHPRPDGQAVRIARIDADSTRAKGALEHQLAQVHAGAVDVLVGTQMVAKGHDFRRITLVAAINPDGALFSSDYRAPERLFALLLQAAGRAGRDASFVQQQGSHSELWVQSFYPQHPLFGALKKHDFPAFAARQIKERQDAGMPPFTFQALLRAEARMQEIAQAFLHAAAARAPSLPGASHVTLYPPIAHALQRVANVERSQMLLESASRNALQAFLSAWQPILHATRAQPAHRRLIRWAVDVDPLQI